MTELIQTTLQPPTWEQLGLILSFIMPFVIYIVGKWLDKRKDTKTIDNIEAGTDKVKADARKIEAETAQTLLISAGDVIDEYKLMLKDLTDKFTSLEKRLFDAETKLDEEIKNRKLLEKTFFVLFNGGHILSEQLKEAKIEPKWKPSVKLIEFLKALKEKNEI